MAGFAGAEHACVDEQDEGNQPGERDGESGETAGRATALLAAILGPKEHRDCGERE